MVKPCTSKMTPPLSVTKSARSATCPPNACNARVTLARAMGKTSTGSGNPDRKSTRLNSSHVAISYAVFCLKKKKQALQSVQALPRGSLPPQPQQEVYNDKQGG